MRTFAQPFLQAARAQRVLVCGRKTAGAKAQFLGLRFYPVGKS